MTQDDLSTKFEELTKEVNVLKSGANNVGTGIFQGVVLALVAWYVLVPIGQWLDTAIYPFHWLIVAINFIVPISVATALIESAKETRKAKYRFWTYCLVEVVIVVWYLVEYPNSIFLA